jgi:preprotein translocase subunit SecA
MHANTLPAPGLFWGAYPERRPRRHEDLARRLASRLALPDALLRGRYTAFAARVAGQCRAWSADSDDTLDARLRGLRPVLARAGLRRGPLVEAFAIVAVHCQRRLGLAPFDTQISAARALLDNRLVEMATGEGKTLAVAIAAATAALAGTPVHVMTANDYLVERDAGQLGPLYAARGLTVGHVISSADAAARRAAHASDVVYCTAKEIGFDYLRDRLAGKRRGDDLRQRAERLAGGDAGQTLLRGLCMAIVDEADSILIDEARVPLILSRAVAGATADHTQALALAMRLGAGRDFEVDEEGQRIRLTDAGTERLAVAAAGLPAPWGHRRHREEWVRLALSALHLFRRDRDYIVREGRVHIVDPTTGRVAVGRAWSQGLHQLIELKEGCAATPDHVVAAQITFQRLFRRYHRLAGVSGTLRESGGELARIYGLPVFCQALRLPSRRRVLPTILHAERGALWRAVAARIGALRAAGRPVLVGTDSVADSEALARTLAAAGIECRVLNARQDEAEAATVALAGQRAQVTVATNMAGRGTDITLGPGVEAPGGLHVICCQHNAARRIDRQLLGRCARQGSPGSVETMLSLDSDLFLKHWPEAWLARLRGGLASGSTKAMARWGALLLGRLAQRREERLGAEARQRLLRADEEIERQLAFGGPME